MLIDTMEKGSPRHKVYMAPKWGRLNNFHTHKKTIILHMGAQDSIKQGEIGWKKKKTYKGHKPDMV